jgi:prepilin-type N-terminal cleavage/methylation domain-containing protein
MKTAAPVKRGFTLIELLVVMGIIGLLVMLLMPVVNYAVVVAQGVATGNTIKRIEAGLAGFYGDFGVYPPSDAQHETLTARTAFGYKNLVIGLGGPTTGTGWGWDGTAADTDKRMPFGGTSDEKFGPYFEGGDVKVKWDPSKVDCGIYDAFKPEVRILYYRYEPAETLPLDVTDNFDTAAVMGFPSQVNLNMLVQRRGSGQYVRRDYVLISAGPDRFFGYRSDPDLDGKYTPANAYTEAGAYCDDFANFKYEQY